MYKIPLALLVDGKEYAIRNKGDFRMVLDCLTALEDEELEKKERILAALIIFYEDINSVEDLAQFPSIENAFNEMCKFFNCGQPESSDKINYKLIDWSQDSQLICSAINSITRTEIRSVDYMHWWTFMGYYLSVGESLLSTIVSIRHKIIKGKALEKHEKEFKFNNPQYFTWNSKTIEQLDLDKQARAMWNSGK